MPTPVVGHGLVFITNSHGSAQPIYAIGLDATGNLSLEENNTSNDSIVWSNLRKGAYLPTPIVVGNYLYLLNDNGVLTCFNAKTGVIQYRERVGGRRGSYSASPVAVNGKLIVTGEYGELDVLQLGPK